MKSYAGFSDHELVVLLQKEDQLAYTEIYNRYSNLLYRHAYKKCGDTEVAQDILQDVYLSLWDKKSNIDATANLSGYLYTILRNKILNLFAQKKVRDVYEESLYKFSKTSVRVTDHLIREKQLHALIDQEIMAMPEKMRQIFILSRQQHLKNKEIADLLGISEHTVATQLKRALKLLRIKLGLVLYIAIVVQPITKVDKKKFQKNIQVLYPIPNS